MEKKSRRRFLRTAITLPSIALVPVFLLRGLQNQVKGMNISDYEPGFIKLHKNGELKARGLMIRHLVMPGNVAQSQKVMQWIASNLPKNTYVNIMSQYTPMFRASEFPEIARRITFAEYQNAVNAARRAGLTNLRLQMQ